MDGATIVLSASCEVLGAVLSAGARCRILPGHMRRESGMRAGLRKRDLSSYRGNARFSEENAVGKEALALALPLR